MKATLTITIDIDETDPTADVPALLDDLMRQSQVDIGPYRFDAFVHGWSR